MAFTKAPTQDTHNVQRVPIQSSPIVVTSTSTTNPVPITSYYINCFPLKESQWGTDPVRAVHKREGNTSTVLTGTVTNTGFRCSTSVQAYSSYLNYVVKHDSLYAVNPILDTVSLITTSQSTLSLGSGTNFIDSANARRIGWLEAYSSGNTYLVTCLEDGTSVTSTDLVSLTVTGSKGLVFIDGYLFAANNAGNRIYNSAAGGVYTTWNSTDFLDAEQYADPVQYIAKHKNYLVAFGSASIEFFYGAAIEVGSPLARQESYSTRVGLVTTPAVGSFYGLPVVNVEDDLYFLGKSEQNNISLYRIRDFKVEEIDSQYVQNALNQQGGSSYRGLRVQVINNNPCIDVMSPGGLMYLIRENDWWICAGNDYPTYLTLLGQPFISYFTASGTPPKSYVLAESGGIVTKWTPDQNYTTTVQADYYTEVIDFGINRWKHLARIDAIGDYNTNQLSLFYNPTPNYAGTFNTITPTAVQASVIGYNNNISWYQLGASRRFILQFRMNGTTPGIHRGFDVEYNMGVA